MRPLEGITIGPLQLMGGGVYNIMDIFGLLVFIAGDSIHDRVKCVLCEYSYFGRFHFLYIDVLYLPIFNRALGEMHIHLDPHNSLRAGACYN